MAHINRGYTPYSHMLDAARQGRFFTVPGGAALALDHLVLQNGVADNDGVSAWLHDWHLPATTADHHHSLTYLRQFHLWFGKRQTLYVGCANLSCDILNLSCVLPNLSCVLPNLSFVLPNLSFVLPNLSCAQVENSNSEFVKTKHLFAHPTYKVAFCQT